MSNPSTRPGGRPPPRRAYLLPRNVCRRRLDNGLVLLVAEDHTTPFTALQGWLRWGSAHDPDDVPGLAHLFEHMIFRGTRRRAPGQAAHEIESAGGRLSATTLLDQTAVSLSVPADAAALAIDVLADAMQRLRLSARELARELDVIEHEQRRNDDDAFHLASRALHAALFQGHGYGRPVLGQIAAMRAVAAGELAAHHRRRYRPEHLAVVAVGDFDARAMTAKLGQAFGRWRPARATPIARPRLRGAPPGRHIEHPRAACHLLLGWRLPPATHRDIPALELVAHALSVGLEHRLGARGQRPIGVEAACFTPREAGILTIGLQVDPASAPEVADALAASLAELGERGPRQDELASGRTRLTQALAHAYETAEGRANKWGFYESLVGSPSFEADFLERVWALEASTCASAAARYLGGAPALIALTAPGCVIDVDRVARRLGGHGLEPRRAPVRRRPSAARPHRGEASPRTPGERPLSPEVPEAPEAPVALGLGSGDRLRVRREPGSEVVALAARTLHPGSTADLTPRLLAAAVNDAIAARRGGPDGLDARYVQLTAVAASTGLELRGRSLDPDRLALPKLVTQLPPFADIGPETLERAVDTVAAELAAEAIDPGAQAHLAARRLVAGVTAWPRAHLVGRRAAVRLARALRATPWMWSLVGDLAAADVRDVLERRRRGSAPDRRGPRRHAEVTTAHGHGQIACRVVDGHAAHLAIAARLPGAALHRVAVEVLAGVLGGGGGLLFHHLREDLGLCYDVDALLEDHPHGPILILRAATSPTAVARVVTEITAILERLQAGPSRPAMERAIAQRRARRMLGSQYAIVRAERLLEPSAVDPIGLPVTDGPLPTALGTAIAAIARRCLTPARLVTAVCGPRHTCWPAGAKDLP